MFQQLNHNMGSYARFILRRDRFRLPVWVISLVLLTVVTAMSYTLLAPTEQDRAMMAATVANPAVTAMFGPGWGLDNYHFGAIMGHQMLLFTALLVAVMSILLTVRHTRGDEEGGRIEMVRSLPVGRLTVLSSTALVMFGANLVLALLTAFGLFVLGLEGIDWHGSLLYGASLGATGFLFAAVTGLFAQLSDNSRGTMGYSFAFLGLAYLVRGIGDVGNETLSWFSPLGWIVRTQVYVNNYWGPFLLTTGAAIAFFALALYLNSLRDLGAGFIPAKPGRKTASPLLLSPLGLAFRLQRGTIIGWAVAMFLLGASYGSVLGDLNSYLESIELIRDVLIVAEGFSLTEQFIPMLMAVMAMSAAIPVLLMILKVRAEESRNRMEHLLARAVSRTSILGSYMLLSVLAGFVMMLAAILGMWSAGAATMEAPLPLSTISNAGMTYLPALWVMSGIGALMVGLLPRAVSFTWFYLGYSFFVVYLGALLQLPVWMARLSPFGHVPKLPVEEANFAVYTILAFIALVLTVIGFGSYNRRDIAG